MSDPIEMIGKSTVQHGPGNDLAYLTKLHPTDAPGIIDSLEQLACSRGYSKVCARIPAPEAGRFVAAGYHLEAALPNFFPEGGSACFMAKYLSADRKQERQPLLVREVLIAADAQQRAAAKPLPAGFAFRLAQEKDAAGMAALYREVFTAKPLRVHDPGYIRAAMKESAIFFGIWKEESMVALSCTEIELASNSAELTHFATLPGYRGLGLAGHLLQQIEGHLEKLGIRSLFSINGAYSFGMNIAFSSNGYRYGGTLTNHTSIYGTLESANVWHKALPDDPKFAWRFLYEADSMDDGRGHEQPFKDRRMDLDS